VIVLRQEVLTKITKEDKATKDTTGSVDAAKPHHMVCQKLGAGFAGKIPDPFVIVVSRRSRLCDLCENLLPALKRLRHCRTANTDRT